MTKTMASLTKNLSANNNGLRPLRRCGTDKKGGDAKEIITFKEIGAEARKDLGAGWPYVSEIRGKIVCRIFTDGGGI